MKKMIALCERHNELPAEHPDIRLRFGDEEVELDMCGGCWDELTAAVTPFLMVGHRPDGFKPSKGRSGRRGKRARMTCDYCPKEISAGSGRALHMRSSHPAEWKREQQPKRNHRKVTANA